MASITTIETIDLRPLPIVALPSQGSKDTPRLPYNSSGRREIDTSEIPQEHVLVNSGPERRALSNFQLVMTILQPSVINFFGSFTSGMLTVGLPVIASSTSLPRSLYLWPSSVYSLTSGAGLLIAGSMTDIIGARHIEVCGIFLIGIFVIACGFAKTGVQLVVFRAFQGIALALHIPASVSIIATAVPAGRARNIGFGCLGLSQPLGFSFGMVVSGIMVERIGWRTGFYLSGASILGVAVASWFTLPRATGGTESPAPGTLVKKLVKEIDWVGGTIASGGLALLSYVLAMVSADLYVIRSATTASLLAVSIVLLVAFPLWMRHRERKGRSALVPNSLWKNLPFASICMLVALAYGAMNTMEIFCSLYFQEVQHQSMLITSLYLLPNLLIGVCINLSVGIFVDRLPAGWLVIGSTLLAALAPLMMALVNPEWKYYYVELWAQMLAALSPNVLYTVGLIIMSDNFPEQTTGLAGAVFSTVSQFGTSLSVGVCQVVSLRVMGSSRKTSGNAGSETSEVPGDILNGYRASFWTMFASMMCCIVIAIVGLRRTGKVGLKKD
ncbi:MFS general substrate transporter [Aaosphaeria arxii CBS 175.79]|uniref:MFS general substrate transporter n=1 Tax=Aaosphaeria arxii CBS 175.79 TaxID=1450172 RepID=A0A6A5XPL3_9PLEO|nr:MFS general substrate transporter [Aaosphaeria arxii CBS 175.79]KAF2015188.1 MFS general substrate transporter [Aaosphaeria arxii CBS 175.79]